VRISELDERFTAGMDRLADLTAVPAKAEECAVTLTHLRRCGFWARLFGP
jgi:hypothetical protein